jgi:hypothetical protein
MVTEAPREPAKAKLRPEADVAAELFQTLE